MVWMVAARSCALMPVVTPCAASTETVKSVRYISRFCATMRCKPSCSARSFEIGTQIKPRPCMAMKLIAFGRRLLRGHDEIAFVLAIGVVGHDHDLPGGDVAQDIVNRVELKGFRAWIITAITLPSRSCRQREFIAAEGEARRAAWRMLSGSDGSRSFALQGSIALRARIHFALVATIASGRYIS